MTVRKFPEKKPEPKVNVEKLIDKGASVKGESQIQEDKKWTYINLRIPTRMLKDIDDAVNQRVGITRTGWMLETIYERLNEKE